MNPARAGERGQATVELALCLPLVATLLALVVEIGCVIADHARLWQAAREAARVSAVDTSAERVAAAARAVGPGPLDLEIEPEERYRVRGEATNVRISFQPRARVPLFGPLLARRTFVAEATMRIEQP